MIVARQDRLNVGCGDDIRDGYINLDIRPVDGVDILSHAHTMPFHAGEFDYVLGQDVLEHFWDYESVLDEWRRVLKPTGTLVIRVPDWDALTNKDIGGEFKFELLEKAVYGGHRTEYDHHHRIYTEDILEERLRDAGFNVVMTERLSEHPVHWHLIGVASDDFVPEQVFQESRRMVTTEL